MNHEFQLGDKVIFSNNKYSYNHNNHLPRNAEGTIVKIHHTGSIGLLFNKDFDGGHDCEVLTGINLQRGWFVKPDEIELATPKNPEDWV